MKKIRNFLKPYYLWLKRTLLKTGLHYVPVMDLSDFKRLLVIAPHPDDEILGVGGGMMSMLENKQEVFVAFLTDGEHSLPDLDPGMVARERVSISQRVLGNLGVDGENICRFSFSDGKLPRAGEKGFDAMAVSLSRMLSSVQPDILLVTHPLETWPYDHVAAYEITAEAMDRSACNCAFFGYWVWLWYSMPITSLFRIRWRNTSRIQLDCVMRKRKKGFIDAYLKPSASNGKPWSGILPEAMVRSLHYPYEILERLR